jgi:hypothetical protein
MVEPPVAEDEQPESIDRAIAARKEVSRAGRRIIKELDLFIRKLPSRGFDRST